jgi:translation initiation factor IF-2
MISGDAAAAPPARGRRGPPGKAGAPDEPGLLVGREQRQLNRRRTGGDRPRGEEDESTPRRRSARVIKRTGTNTAAPRKSRVMLEVPCTVRSFSEAIGVPAQQVLRQMLTLGTMANINAEIDQETAELLAAAWASRSTSRPRTSPNKPSRNERAT